MSLLRRSRASLSASDPTRRQSPLSQMSLSALHTFRHSAALVGGFVANQLSTPLASSSRAPLRGTAASRPRWEGMASEEGTASRDQQPIGAARPLAPSEESARAS